MKNSSLIFSSVLLLTLIAGCGQGNKSSEATSVGDIGMEYTSQADSAAVEMPEEDDEPPMSESGKREIHMAIDLGLPSGVKWAATNVGAENPWDFGEYYALGEIKPSTGYDHTHNKTLVSFPEDERITVGGNPKYDAATANWGEQWQLPSNSNFFELKEECDWKWTNEGGNNGFRITGPNGNSIFLPAAGQKTEADAQASTGVNVSGYYWNAPLFPLQPYRNGYGALMYNKLFSYLSFSSDYRDTSKKTQYHYGLSIRPVTYATYEELGIDEAQLEAALKVNLDSPWKSSKASGVIGDHEYVDLGLPSGLKWATMNVGAKTLLDGGYIYQWGATQPGECYDSTDGSTLGNNDEVSNISGNSNYDVAYKDWGESWRMPTFEEMAELIDICTWTVLNDERETYYLVTGPNKNTLVIPVGEGALWSSDAYSKTMAYGMRLVGGTHMRLNKGSLRAMPSGVLNHDKQTLQLNIRPVSN